MGRHGSWPRRPGGYRNYRRSEERRGGQTWSLPIYGDFLPLQVEGSCSRNIVAFARRHGASWVLAAAPRWISQLPANRERKRTEFNWGDTRLVLPSGSPSLWNSILTSQQVPSFAEDSKGFVKASDLFCDLPVALISGGLGAAS